VLVALNLMSSLFVALSNATLSTDAEYNDEYFWPDAL
jgi:hypothetical protein